MGFISEKTECIVAQNCKYAKKKHYVVQRLGNTEINNYVFKDKELLLESVSLPELICR